MTAADVDVDDVDQADDVEPRERPERWKPGAKIRGWCRECGEPADTPRGTWCALHRPIPPDPAPNHPAEPTGKRSSSGRPSDLEVELRTQFTMAAQLLAFRCPECAMVAVRSAPALAEYWAHQAETSPRVARVLRRTANANGWLGAVMVHGPLVMQLATHHLMPAVVAAPPMDAQPEHEHVAGVPMPEPPLGDHPAWPAEPPAAPVIVPDDGPARPWDADWRARNGLGDGTGETMPGGTAHSV